MATAARARPSIRRFMQLVWNEGRLDAIDEFVAADYVGHDRSGGTVVDGPAGVRSQVAAWRRAVPDLHVQIHDEIAEEDLLAVRWTAGGSLGGDFDGFGDAGDRAEWSGISVFRLLAGKQVESWTYWDGVPPTAWSCSERVPRVHR
jgi:steroid delta-isomerase-like uncharacterized protein